VRRVVAVARTQLGLCDQANRTDLERISRVEHPAGTSDLGEYLSEGVARLDERRVVVPDPAEAVRPGGPTTRARLCAVTRSTGTRAAVLSAVAVASPAAARAHEHAGRTGGGDPESEAGQHLAAADPPSSGLVARFLV
jgi:hypothetical protein